MKKKEEEEKEVTQTLLGRIDYLKDQLSNMKGQLDTLGNEALKTKVEELSTKVVLDIIEESSKEVYLRNDGQESYFSYMKAGAEQFYAIIKRKLKEEVKKEN